MNRFFLLTNQWVMVLGLISIAVLSMAINIVFRIVPVDQAYELAFFFAMWFHAAWLLAVALELNVLKLKRFARVGWFVMFGSCAISFMIVFAKFGVETDAVRVHVTKSLVPASLIGTFSLSGLIAERISTDRTSNILNFWWLINWPVFLFMVAVPIRRAVEEP